MGLLRELFLKFAVSIIITTGGLSIMSDFGQVGGTGTLPTGGITALQRLSDLVNRISGEASNAVPDTSNPLDFGWSIVTGIWNGIRLFFELSGIMLTLLGELLTGSTIYMPWWVYPGVSLLINVIVVVLIIEVAHQRSG